MSTVTFNLTNAAHQIPRVMEILVNRGAHNVTIDGNTIRGTFSDVRRAHDVKLHVQMLLDFWVATELLNNGMVTKYEIFPQAGPNQTIKLHTNNNGSYVFQARYDPNTNRVFPPAEPSQ